MDDEILIASFNRSNTTATNSELTEVFSEVGSRYGCAEVKAKLRTLKVSKYKSIKSLSHIIIVMSSGRRESVMIFCTSPFSRLYLDPIDHYEPDTVHIFTSNCDDTISSVERELYKLSKNKIECKNIVEHSINTSDYNEVLGEIIEVINGLHKKYGNDLDIFINISSGTPEFSAAGMFATMLPCSAIAFRVDTESTLSPDELAKIVNDYNDSLKTTDPERVTGLKNDRPDDEMVTFLRIVNVILKNTKYPKYREMINKLKEADAWTYDPEKKANYGKTSLQEKEERYLKRHYIAIALENGWIERPSPNTMRLTDSGRAYISVYDREDRLMKKEIRANEMCCSNRELFEERSIDMMDYYEPFETNKVTFGKNGKSYTFTIGMDQHR